MSLRYWRHGLALIVLASASPVRAEVFLTVEQAQQVLFPGETLSAHPLTLNGDQIRAIEKMSGVRVREPQIKLWQASGGGWMFVDRVLGKHEFITYALSLDADGAVRQIEILEYRETYGGEVRDPRWRAQFVGKKAGAPLQIDDDIHNISGATLSSVHITEGVRRLLATYAIAVAHE
ncbi:FMN-binding domain-containing protein [Fontimonas thermophila]|uniref:FMN-binding domain-containing protein n=1 Tax=Fontimonas thermophila TaxID=1076937 RepID=A0A1I2IET3_9GAMM|nr:FMN-binding protein [Fontimonas thermophila]SFF39346.1 FMN-binding domain-containing protein [Fontimonas thermophila]